MKIRHLAILASFLPLAAVPLAAQAADEHAGHGNHSPAAMQSTEGSFVDGVVKKIDKAGGKVTVSHGPLTNLNMPAMTMVFRVKNTAWLDGMKPEGKIRFVADYVGGTLTIVKLDGAQ